MPNYRVSQPSGPFQPPTPDTEPSWPRTDLWVATLLVVAAVVVVGNAVAPGHPALTFMNAVLYLAVAGTLWRLVTTYMAKRKR